VLGNEDIQGLNLNWLRSQISLVGQEPTLFNTTIFENISFGLEEDATSSTCDMEALVEEAAKKANAHDFISSLPLGYQTLVGEKGAQLSGGQKQRICIARAMIKNPQILLLDEATSALDVGAERSVQLALAVAAQDRTTIVIAHRLSTIRRADNIVVMSQGRIIEQGTHDELIANRGAYAELVEKQHISSEIVASVPNPDGDCNRIEHDGVVEKESFLYDSQSQSMDKDESSDPEKALNATSEAAEKQKSPVSEGSWSTSIKVIGRLSRPEIGIIIPAAVLTLIAGLAVPA
jgi:ATP-binding cassette subfamily B (MDR/TAP) protein 1